MKSVSVEKKLVDKLIKDCTETVEEETLAKTTSAENQNKHKYSSRTLYIVLFSIIFTINVGICTYIVYLQRYLKKDLTRVTSGTRTEKTIQ